MNSLIWIIVSTFSISLMAWVGGLLPLFLNEKTLKKIILPLVALSAGSLMGGAFLHLIPEAIASNNSELGVFIWVLIGFSVFFTIRTIYALASLP